MLTGYRSNNTPEKMNRYNYIVFGIENYYLRLTSIFDRCLRLANIIYQIGLPEQQCNNNSIIKNLYIKGTSVAKALKEIDKFTTPFRSHRNKVAHQATYLERELEQLGSYYYLLEEDNEFYKYYNSYKQKTDRFVVDKKDKFKQNVINIKNLVKLYFDALNKIFDNKLKLLILID